MTAPTGPLSLGDGSRGRLCASPLRADRVGTPSRLSQQGLSQAKLLPALRGALRDYRGLIGFLILFALIFGIGRHWHG